VEEVNTTKAASIRIVFIVILSNKAQRGTRWRFGFYGTWNLSSWYEGARSGRTQEPVLFITHHTDVNDSTPQLFGAQPQGARLRVKDPKFSELPSVLLSVSPPRSSPIDRSCYSNAHYTQGNIYADHMMEG
jgi:hypothetical protein